MDDCKRQIRHIGLRIAYFRKMRDMTQLELAEKVCINKNYLSQIERGSTDKVISLPLLIQVAAALNVTLPVLVDVDDRSLSSHEMRQQLDDMRSVFDELKIFNAELDKLIVDMDKFN